MPVYVGLRAKFFHPMTFGVMHDGLVVRVLTNGMVSVYFFVDEKTHTTYQEHNP